MRRKASLSTLEKAKQLGIKTREGTLSRKQVPEKELKRRVNAVMKVLPKFRESSYTVYDASKELKKANVPVNFALAKRIETRGESVQHIEIKTKQLENKIRKGEISAKQAVIELKKGVGIKQLNFVYFSPAAAPVSTEYVRQVKPKLLKETLERFKKAEKQAKKKK